MLLPGEAGASLNDKTRGVAHPSHRFMLPTRARRFFFAPAHGRGATGGGRERTRGAPMGLVELFLIAVGLSMDAFAVAVCKASA